MKTKRIMMLIILVVMFTITMARAEGMSGLSVEEQTNYEKIQNLIDQGDCVGYASMLLNGGISQRLYDFIVQKELYVIDCVMVDAIIQFTELGQIENIVELRQSGYIADAHFIDYWMAMGYGSPVDSIEPERQDVDNYLIREMSLAFDRDEYVISKYAEMYDSGKLSDEMQAALVNALGFDYLDEQYLTEQGIAPLRNLSDEERSIYNEVMNCIDRGDFMRVAQMMLVGEVNENVYASLAEHEWQIIDYMVAQAMAQFAEQGEYLSVVCLRLDGFVTDDSFGMYWEMLNRRELMNAVTEINEKYIDAYMLLEFEYIVKQVEKGESILSECWNAGMISDVMYETLMDRLNMAA